jgi:hypothetical protein
LRRVVKRKPNLQLAGLFSGSLLLPGSVVEVDFTAPFSLGEAVVYTMRAGRYPILRILCLPPGRQNPVACG